MSEVRADKSLAFQGNFLLSFKQMTHLRKAIVEKFFGRRMTFAKIRHNRGQQLRDVGFSQRHYLSDDSPGDLFGSRAKGAHQDARTVWQKNRANAFGVDWRRCLFGHEIGFADLSPVNAVR